MPSQYYYADVLKWFDHTCIVIYAVKIYKRTAEYLDLT